MTGQKWSFPWCIGTKKWNWICAFGSHLKHSPFVTECHLSPTAPVAAFVLNSSQSSKQWMPAGCWGYKRERGIQQWMKGRGQINVCQWKLNQTQLLLWLHIKWEEAISDGSYWLCGKLWRVMSIDLLLSCQRRWVKWKKHSRKLGWT